MTFQILHLQVQQERLPLGVRVEPNYTVVVSAPAGRRRRFRTMKKNIIKFIVVLDAEAITR